MAGLTENLKVRVDAETLAALERRAAAADRNVGQLVRVVLRDYLVREGELEEAVKRD